MLEAIAYELSAANCFGVHSLDETQLLACVLLFVFRIHLAKIMSPVSFA